MLGDLLSFHLCLPSCPVSRSIDRGIQLSQTTPNFHLKRAWKKKFLSSMNGIRNAELIDWICVEENSTLNNKVAIRCSSSPLFLV